MQQLQNLIQHISQSIGTEFRPAEVRNVGGGSINSSLLLQDDARRFFVKLNQAQLADMFAAEAEGLRDLRQANCLRVPEVICYGSDESQAWLVLEHIRFSRGKADSSRLAGQQLAELHQHVNERFGWRRDNTIGSTAQSNDWQDDWIEFWKQQRLGFQLELLKQNGYSGQVLDLGEQLRDRCDALINHQPQASLLHGDLWGGNMAFDENGLPVIFDPATYYGDREADLAMTELFGGFGRDFYAAYQQAWPLDVAYQTRKTFYNLYHILNHTNLFGGGYHSQAISMMQRLLAELK
ncbi:MAG: fructosamine kinase family protein [Chromatiales bacterium]|jgi:fructosamine-3-kinase